MTRSRWTCRRLMSWLHEQGEVVLDMRPASSRSGGGHGPPRRDTEGSWREETSREYRPNKPHENRDRDDRSSWSWSSHRRQEDGPRQAHHGPTREYGRPQKNDSDYAHASSHDFHRDRHRERDMDRDRRRDRDRSRRTYPYHKQRPRDTTHERSSTRNNGFDERHREPRSSSYRSSKSHYGPPERKRRRESASPTPTQSPSRSRDSVRGPLEKESSTETAKILPRKGTALSIRGAAERARQASQGWTAVQEKRTDSTARSDPAGPPPPGPPPGPPPLYARLSTANKSPASSTPETYESTAHVHLDEAYDIVGQVGEGMYGQVYKATSSRKGTLVALKRIRMDGAREGFPVTSMREMKLLQSLRHENVIRLHETMTSRSGSVYMVFEYMEHDLHGILVHPKVSFTDAHRKSLASQLLHGLAYLHQRAILHRDLKGSNLLLNNQGILKLADFGLARTYYKRKAGDYTNRVVTLWYRPPELLLGATHYGPEVDMWGAGCLFLELFTRKALFQGRDEIHQLHVITRTLGALTASAWPDVTTLPWYELLRLDKDTSQIKFLDSSTPTTDPSSDTPDGLAQHYAALVSPGALEMAHGLLTYNPVQRWSAQRALRSAYFISEEPRPEAPAAYVSFTLTYLQGPILARWRLA